MATQAKPVGVVLDTDGVQSIVVASESAKIGLFQNGIGATFAKPSEVVVNPAFADLVVGSAVPAQQTVNITTASSPAPEAPKAQEVQVTKAPIKLLVSVSAVQSGMARIEVELPKAQVDPVDIDVRIKEFDDWKWTELPRCRGRNYEVRVVGLKPATKYQVEAVMMGFNPVEVVFLSNDAVANHGSSWAQVSLGG